MPLCWSFFGFVASRAVQASDNATEQEIVIGPERDDMTLVSFQPWVLEGEILGAVGAYVYDDITTERPADYWELYDKDGNLLAISWFDKFGIQRTAIDRAILEEEDMLDGIFVVVVDDNSI